MVKRGQCHKSGVQGINISDGQFLDLFRRDPEAALRRLLADYKDRLYFFCLRAAGNRADAEDLTQDIFVRIWKGLDGFRGGSSLNTWIYRIAWNVCADHISARGRAPEMTAYIDEGDDDAPATLIPEGSETSDEFETQEFWDRLVERLPAAHKLVLTLYYFQELRYEEIAAVTGWPLGTVKATLHRAKEGLRREARRELEEG